MTYPFDGIQINGREVSLTAISNSAAIPQTDFENSTFEFIREWLSDQNEFYFQTSGSTGKPKVISFSRKQIQASAARTAGVLGMKAGETICVCIGTLFIAGKMMLVRAFEKNLKIIAIEPSSNPFQKINVAVDYISLVPLQIQEILEHDRSRLNTLKGILVGGAAISTSLKTKIQSLDCPVYATYGMTETLSNVAMQRLSGGDAKNSFSPLTGVTITLDSRGCLAVQDGQTDINVFTNDIAEILEDGSFIITGRTDNIINSGGVKISPEYAEEKIEPVLRSNDIHNPFIISSIKDEKFGDQVVLLIEGVVPGKVDLIATIAGHLTTYERPKKVISMKKFAYTANGKIHRQKTAELIGKSQG